MLLSDSMYHYLGFNFISGGCLPCDENDEGITAKGRDRLTLCSLITQYTNVLSSSCVAFILKYFET